jgi:hypothetical protein
MINQNQTERHDSSKPREAISSGAETMRQGFHQIDSELLAGLWHGHFDLQMTGMVSNESVRLLTVKSGKVYRYSIQVSDLETFQTGMIVPLGRLRGLLDKVHAEVSAGLRHGYFEISVTCETVRDGRLNVLVKAGKSFRFLIDPSELVNY